MAKILIIDDDDASRSYLVKLLGYKGHTTLQAENGATALELIRNDRPELVISDLLMPVMDGFEFVRQLRINPAIAKIPVIFLSGNFRGIEGEELAHTSGVHHMLEKPCKSHFLLCAIEEVLTSGESPSRCAELANGQFHTRHADLINRALLEKTDSLEQAKEQLTQACESLLQGWVNALDLRDNETEGHTQRVTSLAVALGRAMGLQGEDLENLRRGALLHDIGKIGIPDAILHNNGPLTDEEQAIMRRHPEYAKRLLATAPFPRDVIDIPMCHHERWDGAGYPNGLKGEEIPEAARIFSVIDVWDALTSERPYKPAWPDREARTYILHQAGKQFDPHVVRAFLELNSKTEDETACDFAEELNDWNPANPYFSASSIRSCADTALVACDQ